MSFWGTINRYARTYLSRAGSKRNAFWAEGDNGALTWIEDPFDVHRVDKYSRFTLVFLGQQQKVVYEKITERLGAKSKYSLELYLAYNLAGLISRKFADLTCGEEPEIKGEKNQLVIDDIVKDSDFGEMLYKACTSVGYKGDIILMPTIRNNKVVIRLIKPEEWFPVFDNNDQIIEATIAWVEKFPDPTDHKKWDLFVRKEIHTPGKIENKMFRLDKNGRLEKEGEVPIQTYHPDVLPEQPTGVDEILPVHIPNYATVDNLFGISDYEDVFDMFEALSSRITGISRILDLHSDPMLSVPDGFMEKDPKTSKWRLKKTGSNVYPTQGDEKDPKYITWDGALEAAFKHVQHLIDGILQIMEISPALVGMQPVSGIESAAKMRLNLTNTMAKINRKRMYLGNGLEHTFEIAFKLGNAWNIFKADVEEEITVVWENPLPTDRREEAEIEAIRLQGKATTSIESSIGRLDGEDLVEQEIERMDTEKEKNAPPPIDMGEMEDNPFEEQEDDK